jgi:shikimate dehydrogenase
MTDQYAVLGNPVEHSKSPIIHAAFAAQTGEDICYNKELVALDAFSESVDALIQQGFKGFNITVPFKEQAYEKADTLSKRARQAGAVNTLIIKEDGSIEGDNTDGLGMVSDIVENHGWALNNKTVLLLGAGGAVRGVLGPLLSEKPKQVVICNRTFSKADNLAKAFAKEGNIVAASFEQLKGEFDIIINGTSASLAGEMLPIPNAVVGKTTCCYDMMYGDDLTVFLNWAKNLGATKLADGLGMLVGQAAESFKLWRGLKPETQAVIRKLRAK